MKNLDYIDELNNYLMMRDKENFLKRYSEVLKGVSQQSEEFVELQLLKYTYGFLFVGDFEKLLLEIEKLEPLMKEYSNDRQKIRFLVNKGITLGRLNKTDEAIQVYNSSLEYCNTDDRVSFKISILTNIGVIYFREQNFIKSLKYFLSAYNLNKGSEGQVKLTSLLINIGIIYLQFDVFDKAIYYLELSLTTIPKSREYAKINIYNNLISTYAASGNFEKARKIIDLSRSEKKNYSQADEMYFHRSLAFYYSKNKEYRKAIDEYQLILRKLTCDKQDCEKTKYKIMIARTYSEMEDYKHCGELIDDIDKHQDLDPENKIYSYNEFLETKVSYYTFKKDYKSALTYSTELYKLQKEENKSLEKHIIGELTNPLTNPLTNKDCNISFEAYEDKINELEGTNKELNEQEKLLIQSLNDLRNESKLREKIISIISHDIRAPIGNIIQLLEILDEYEDQNEREEIIVEVIDAMKQTYSLTNELVDWAKEIIDAQKSTLSYINVKDIVNEIDLLYRQQLEKKQIFIINNLSEEEIIFSHKTSIKTCFRNIIQNAIKYSEPYSRIEVNEEINDYNVIYSIKDYGKGIPPEELKDLFDVKKISTVGTNQESGIGIGLLLVNELIKRNNGKIRCESVVGKGATFYFTFPIDLSERLNYIETNNQNEDKIEE
jgi:pentatricopeptide repeat protein